MRVPPAEVDPDAVRVGGGSGGGGGGGGEGGVGDGGKDAEVDDSALDVLVKALTAETGIDGSWELAPYPTFSGFFTPADLALFQKIPLQIIPSSPAQRPRTDPVQFSPALPARAAPQVVRV